MSLPNFETATVPEVRTSSSVRVESRASAETLVTISTVILTRGTVPSPSPSAARCFSRASMR